MVVFNFEEKIENEFKLKRKLNIWIIEIKSSKVDSYE